MTPIPIGSTLKRFRQAAGLSQTAAAGLAGMSQGQYADYERDAKQNITLDTLTRLAKALNVTVADLVGEEAPPCKEQSPPRS